MTNDRLEEKLFFSFVFFALAHRKRLTFILEKPFFMQVNPVFIKTTFFVCAVSKQILFFYNQNLFYMIHSMYHFGSDIWYLLFDKLTHNDKACDSFDSFSKFNMSIQ